KVSGLHDLVGYSAPMQVGFNLVRKASNLDNSVLITGESGTGKELIARGIHENGSRSRRPFVAVSCGAIPDTLIESELFGHEKGAFTGALAMNMGQLEAANGGTVCFDGMRGALRYAQAKVLRAIESREVSRIGSRRRISLDIRIIEAT